ncbi:colicin B immunity protein, partial [Escherichia coli]|nr:colicin B immunity protein [Escherichia coli]
MTTLMSNYNKTAPVMGILVFLCTYKTREIIKPVTRKLVVQSCFWGAVFYAILIYITLFYNLELTTAGGFFKLLSHNVITLFILYCSIYFTVLTMTYAILLMPLLVIKYFKGRQ